MVKRNAIFYNFSNNYLFDELQKIKENFIKKYPHKQLIDLSIGDTSQPLSKNIINAIQNSSIKQGKLETYSGYGPVSGQLSLRQKIVKYFYSKTNIHPDDIFISDGAKPAFDRLHRFFGSNISVSLPDPAYPAYKDICIANGVSSITLLPCSEKYDFFPDIEAIPRTDIIHLCSPNNPTGTVVTRKYLQQLVNTALKNQSIIIFDAVYSAFITSSTFPRSIFEIPGAEKCAIEVNSLSKSAGFSGLRLGWIVISDKLCYDNQETIKSNWKRLNSSIFNGASSIIQNAAEAALTNEKYDLNETIKVYKNNALMLKKTLLEQGITTYGGEQSPYLWIKLKGLTSKEAFNYFLNEFNILTSPGSGFGPSGEGYLRLSGLASQASILSSIERINRLTA